MSNQIFLLLVFAAVAVVISIMLWRRFLISYTVHDFQQGLLYRHGSFVKVLGAGRYTLMRGTSFVEVFDMRRTILNVPGQDILTKDKVSIKISTTGYYEVRDPLAAKNNTQSYISELYNGVQLALREIIGRLTLEEALEQKAQIDSLLLAALQDKAQALGLALSSFAVRDFILPANLKRAFAGVVEAQKEAHKQLEKARGEQAVLRSLANSARLYEGNPALLQARIVQALAEGKNTVVFNADGAAIHAQPPQT